MTSASARRFIGAVEDEYQLYSDNKEDYTIGLPIGYGASSIVYAATFCPRGSRAAPVACAVKVIDLDKLPPHALHLLRRETQLMSLSKHPNVLRVRGSWTDGHYLCIALRIMNAGSAADVMRYAWSGGFEEEVVKCILKQALEGLNYLHINGFIHRDVKAANMLIDDDGTVLMADLGVAADLWDDQAAKDSDNYHKRVVSFEPGATARASAVTGSIPSRPVMTKRKSFVGTPAWMAPEVIKGKQYDVSADIWSFGITAIELTQGRAPRSRESPQKVLLRTVQDAPPEFARVGGDGQNKYSRAFAEMVQACLDKDPAKRPTAEQLLQLPLFKTAKKKSYLVGAILRGLPPLTQRQERRRVPQHPTRTSIESWDFSTLSHPNSPVPTRLGRPGGSAFNELHEIRGIHSRSRSGSEHNLEHHANESRISIPRSITRSQLSRHSGSRDHSRSVSWIEDDDSDNPLNFSAEVPDERTPLPLNDSPLEKNAATFIPDEAASATTTPVVEIPFDSQPRIPARLSVPVTIPDLSSSPESPSLSPLATPSNTSNGFAPSPVPPASPFFAAASNNAQRSAAPIPPTTDSALDTSPGNAPSLWQKLRGNKERRGSSSSDKEKRRGSITGLLYRTVSNTGSGGVRGKLMRGLSENK